MPTVDNYVHQTYAPSVNGPELVAPPNLEEMSSPALVSPPPEDISNQIHELPTFEPVDTEPSITVMPDEPAKLTPPEAQISSPIYEGSSYDSSLETPSADVTQVDNLFLPDATPIMAETPRHRLSSFKFNRPASLITAGTLLFIVVVGLGSFLSSNLTARLNASKNSGKQVSSSSQFAVSSLSLQGIQPSTSTQISTVNELTVNGQLQVTNALTVTDLSTLNGGVVIVGPTDINTTGTDDTNIGNPNSAVNLNGNTTISSNLSVQGGNLAIGGSVDGKLILRSATNSFTTSLQASNQTNNLNLNIPADNAATDTICLSILSNCLSVGAPAGDLTGTYPNPTIAKLQSKTLTISTTPVTGAVLQYNGSAIVDGLLTNANLNSGNFTNIVGTGSLTTGSIANGFGTISTTNDITTTANIQANAFTGDGLNLTSLNANNITTGTIADARLSTNVTLQGNTFNGVNQLVQTNASGELPALSGANLTSLNGSNITTGTIADARLSTNVTLQGNTFNGASQLVQLDGSAQLPAFSGVNLTSLNGSNITTGTVADARLSTNVTLQGNSFNGVSQLVQTNASGELPALSGANLTFLNGSNISSGTVADARLSTNVTLQGNTFNGVSQLVQTNASGELPALSGANLTFLNGSNISSGTIADARLSTNVTLLGNSFNGISQLVKTNISGELPVISGVNLTNLNGSNISSGTVADARLSANVTLQGNIFNGVSQLVQTNASGELPVISGVNLTNLNGSSISTGTVADVRLSSNVTLQGNTFNGVSQLVQTNASGELPALSGANLTNLNASNISSGTISNSLLSSNVALLNGTGPQTFTGNNKFTGSVLLQNTANSTSAVQIQTSTASPVFTVDTTNQQTILTSSGTDAVLGSALVDTTNATQDLNSANWTSTDWTTIANSATHITGNTSALTNTGFTPTIGTTYQVSYTYSLCASGTNTLTVTFAGSALQNANDCIGTNTVVVTATSTAPLTFTPSSTYIGVVSGVKIQDISSQVASALTIKNSSNTSTLEVRSSGSNSNIFIGLNAGKNNTAVGTGNTGLGASTLQNNTAGYVNTATGANALQNNSTGYANTAAGLSAMQANVTGFANTSLGASVLKLNVIGSNNIAVGANALESNIVSSNTAIGVYVLQASSTGGSNTAGGEFTLQYNVSGSLNTALGYQAGMGINGLSNLNNETLYGYGAGAGLQTGGDNNVLIGYNAGANLTTGSGNIVLGYNISAVTATSTQTLNIGNIIFGIGLDGSGTTLSSGSVAIGMATPSATSRLIVNGVVESWGGLKFPLNSAAPFVCTAPITGTLEMTLLFKICVCNGSTWVNSSDGSSSCNWNMIAPAPITGLTTTQGAPAVTANWNLATSTTAAPVAGIDVFKNGVLQTTLGPTATTYQYTGLTSGAGTTYTFSVQPKNAVGAPTATVITVYLYTATATPNYVCSGGGTYNGTGTATGSCGNYLSGYSCPSGGSLSGTTCYVTNYYPSPATGTGTAYYPYPATGTGTAYYPYPATGTAYYPYPATGTAYYPYPATGTAYYPYPASSTTYSCPSGGTLSGTTCTIGWSSVPTFTSSTTCTANGYNWGGAHSGCWDPGSTYTATATTTYCNSGGSWNGTNCGTYTTYCNSGGSWNGSNCGTYTTYCNSGGSWNGSNCGTYTTYCNSGGSWNGSNCGTYTYTTYCNSGGSWNGTDCGTYQTTYAATAVYTNYPAATIGSYTYSCPSGGTLYSTECSN